MVKEIENNITEKKKNKYNRKTYERQRKSFEENTKKEKGKEKEIKPENGSKKLSKIRTTMEKKGSFFQKEREKQTE